MVIIGRIDWSRIPIGTKVYGYDNENKKDKTNEVYYFLNYTHCSTYPFKVYCKEFDTTYVFKFCEPVNEKDTTLLEIVDNITEYKISYEKSNITEEKFLQDLTKELKKLNTI